MTSPAYVSPSLDKAAFHCSHCGAYAKHQWGQGRLALLHNPSFPNGLGEIVWSGTLVLHDTWCAICQHCEGMTIRKDEQTIYPSVSDGPLPNPDMPDDIRADFEEARRTSHLSPRGAAALLRLCVQKLCNHLGESGTNINDDIGKLVRKGLPIQIQQALDIVRVIGNNAVHPGQIDLKDDRKSVLHLFQLVNLITEFMITQPKQLEDLYNGLPESAKKQIVKRDQTSV